MPAIDLALLDAESEELYLLWKLALLTCAWLSHFAVSFSHLLALISCSDEAMYIDQILGRACLYVTSREMKERQIYALSKPAVEGGAALQLPDQASSPI